MYMVVQLTHLPADGGTIVWLTSLHGGTVVWLTSLHGGTVIWLTTLHGGMVVWLTSLHGGMVVWLTSLYMVVQLTHLPVHGGTDKHPGLLHHLGWLPAVGVRLPVLTVQQ